MQIFRHNGISRMLRFLLATVVMILAARAASVLAQAPDPEGPKLIPSDGMIGACSFVTGDFDFECIPLYLSYLTKLVFSLAGGFAMVEIIKAGYEYAASAIPGGIAEKESAKKRITHAIFGLSVVIFAYLIVDAIISIIFLGPA